MVEYVPEQLIRVSPAADVPEIARLRLAAFRISPGPAAAVATAGHAHDATIGAQPAGMPGCRSGQPF
jgi:hypothetical protein